MNFEQLSIAVRDGLIQQIPIVGPVLQNILRVREEGAFQNQLIEVLDRLANNRKAADVRAEYPALMPALFVAEAARRNQLAPRPQQGRRFLYLASRGYANAECTYELAVNRSFLWRSFHAEMNSRTQIYARIANVARIQVGDIVVLGYRNVEPLTGTFRVLIPLVVQSEGPHSVPIDTVQFPRQRYSPFSWANQELEQNLIDLNYENDPRFGRQTGLNVLPLSTDVSTELARAALEGDFRSPGPNAIWQFNSPRIPREVREWIAAL